MNAKQVNALVRLRKAIDNLEAAFEPPAAHKGTVKITQGKKPSKASMAPYASLKRKGAKSTPKSHGMNSKGKQG